MSFVPASSVDEVLASSMETVESMVPPHSTEDSDQEGPGEWEKINDDVAVARATLVHNMEAHDDAVANLALSSFTPVEVDDTSLDERLQEMNAAMARLLSKGDEKVEIKEEAAPAGDFVPEGGPSEKTEAVAMDTDPVEASTAPGDFVPEAAAGDDTMGPLWYCLLDKLPGYVLGWGGCTAFPLQCSEKCSAESKEWFQEEGQDVQDHGLQKGRSDTRSPLPMATMVSST